ncbi:hypothetical protein LGK97_18915 [Clostridium sp. CS001]|uniref:hypothetical protein n=1 Tax=Clostridium sp. CS001 TaxID=2880648 RepID=UPI001CF0D8D3|nr:hypothetical protein [Clostridium sp. CS001]MCB2291787.1 hypothetical protein [Clostridium sp. CS001]
MDSTKTTDNYKLTKAVEVVRLVKDIFNNRNENETGRVTASFGFLSQDGGLILRGRSKGL